MRKLLQDKSITWQYAYSNKDGLMYTHLKQSSDSMEAFFRYSKVKSVCMKIYNMNNECIAQKYVTDLGKIDKNAFRVELPDGKVRSLYTKYRFEFHFYEDSNYTTLFCTLTSTLGTALKKLEFGDGYTDVPQFENVCLSIPQGDGSMNTVDITSKYNFKFNVTSNWIGINPGHLDFANITANSKLADILCYQIKSSDSQDSYLPCIEVSPKGESLSVYIEVEEEYPGISPSFSFFYQEFDERRNYPIERSSDSFKVDNGDSHVSELKPYIKGTTVYILVMIAKPESDPLTEYKKPDIVERIIFKMTLDKEIPKEEGMRIGIDPAELLYL